MVSGAACLCFGLRGSRRFASAPAAAGARSGSHCAITGRRLRKPAGRRYRHYRVVGNDHTFGGAATPFSACQRAEGGYWPSSRKIWGCSMEVLLSPVNAGPAQALERAAGRSITGMPDVSRPGLLLHGEAVRDGTTLKNAGRTRLRSRAKGRIADPVKTGAHFAPPHCKWFSQKSNSQPTLQFLYFSLSYNAIQSFVTITTINPKCPPSITSQS